VKLGIHDVRILLYSSRRIKLLFICWWECEHNKRRTETTTFSRANKKKERATMVRTCNKDSRGEESRADIRSETYRKKRKRTPKENMGG
jgi:serine protease inhibitor